MITRSGKSYQRQPITNKCIILDLDATLINTHEIECKLTKIFSTGVLNKTDAISLRSRIYTHRVEDIGEPMGKGSEISYWGITRPYVYEFIDFLFKYFNIVTVYSAGQSAYVEEISDYLFRDYQRPHVVFNYSHCIFVDSVLTKSINSMINHDINLSKYMNLTNTFALDDNFDTFRITNPYNGVHIPEYKVNCDIKSMLSNNDDMLMRFKYWLLQPEVINSTDVRELNKSDIFNYTVDEYRARLYECNSPYKDW